jgi:hypothetical protein
MSTDIFISAGRNSKPEHEKFISEIEQFLRNNGLNPRAVGRNEFTASQPLKYIKQVMNECSGTVVIAFERIHLEQGYEKRGSDAEKPLSNVNISTVWNQIEASMAYVFGHPLLVIVETGVRSEGLLETGYDWYVQWVDMNASTLQEREFLGVFADWKKQVEGYKINGKKDLSNKPTSIDPKELTISQIVGSLKPAQLWTIIGTIVTAIVAIAGAAYKLGTLNPTPVKTGISLENVYQIRELSVSRNVGITSPLQRMDESHLC